MSSSASEREGEDDNTSSHLVTDDAPTPSTPGPGSLSVSVSDPDPDSIPDPVPDPDPPTPSPLPKTPEPAKLDLPASKPCPSWFASDPSKAYYEKFSLIWAPLSMAMLLGVVLGTPIYKYCDRNSFLAISIAGCLPGFVFPLFFPCHHDVALPFTERFWVKGTVWITIYSFYGNYFWTHYFYQLLEAEYLFDSYRFNDVPIVCYICTFFYFTFYFNLVTLILRRVAYWTCDFPAFGRSLLWWWTIGLLSYGTAVFEALSVAHFPLYTYRDRDAFIVFGSLVYGLYFLIGFPMFFKLDEPLISGSSTLRPSPWPSPWRSSLYDTAVNALASTAVVTLLLDLWRLCLGSVYDLGSVTNIKLPFVYQADESANIASTVSTIPTPSPKIIYVEKEVTPQACAEVARAWASSTLSKIQANLRFSNASLS